MVNILGSESRVPYIQYKIVYDAFMNEDRTAITQLYRVIQEEWSIFWEVRKKIQVKHVSHCGCLLRKNI